MKENNPANKRTCDPIKNCKIVKNVALFPTKSFHSSKAILAKFLFSHLSLAHVFKCSIYVMFWSWITSVTNKLDIPATAKFHHGQWWLKSPSTSIIIKMLHSL